ncbi:unnamed protein product, partial [Discosporangium mesarthrocarpum]
MHPTLFRAIPRQVNPTRARTSLALSAASEEVKEEDVKEVAAPDVLAKEPIVPTKTSTPALVSGASVATILGADILLRRGFVRAGVAFPSSLAGMMALFAGLVAMDQVSPKTAERTVSALEPGSALLARWLPVFFVPSLVVLPLSPALSPSTAARLGLLVVAGWVASLVSTAKFVTSLSSPSLEAPLAEPATPPAPFAPSLVVKLGLGGTMAGVLATGVAVFPGLASRLSLGAGATVPLRAVSLLQLTLAGFALGTKVPPKVSKAVHPLITCSLVALGGVGALAKGAGMGFKEGLKGYITRS